MAVAPTALGDLPEKPFRRTWAPAGPRRARGRRPGGAPAPAALSLSSRDQDASEVSALGSWPEPAPCRGQRALDAPLAKL